jgi:hypothetical protein
VPKAAAAFGNLSEAQDLRELALADGKPAGLGIAISELAVVYFSLRVLIIDGLRREAPPDLRVE